MATANNINEKHQPLISILSVNYNQPEVTLEMLNSFKDCTYPNYEIIIVDNASFKNPNLIKEMYPEVKLVKSKKNLGFAGGNNLGLEYCKGDYILFINNDTEIKPDFLEPLVSKLSSDDKIAAVSPKIVYFNPGNIIQYAGSERVNPFTLRNKHFGTGCSSNTFNECKETAYAHGACMLVKKSVIDHIGKMDEQFFLYYEEQDWCERMLRNNYTIHYVPQSVILHKESVSTGKNSPLKTYYLTRNRILFARKNFDAFTLFLSMFYMLLISIPKNTLTLLKDKALLKAYYKGIFWNLTNKPTI